MDRLIAAITRIQERKRQEQLQQDRGQALQQFFQNLKGNLSSYSIPGTPDSSVDVPVERPRFGASPEGDVTKRTIPGTPDQQVQYLSIPGFLSGLSGMDPKLAGAVDPSLIGFGNYADAARGSATLGEMLERNAATQREQAAGRDVSAAFGDTSVRGAPVLQALARIDPKGAAALLSGYDANGLNREQFGFEKDVKFPWSQRVDAHQLAQGDARLVLEKRGQELAGSTLECERVLGHVELNLYRLPSRPSPEVPGGLTGSRVILISGYSYWRPITDLLADPALKLELHRTSTHTAALQIRRHQYASALQKQIARYAFDDPPLGIAQQPFRKS